MAHRCNVLSHTTAQTGLASAHLACAIRGTRAVTSSLWHRHKHTHTATAAHLTPLRVHSTMCLTNLEQFLGRSATPRAQGRGVCVSRANKTTRKANSSTSTTSGMAKMTERRLDGDAPVPTACANSTTLLCTLASSAPSRSMTPAATAACTAQRCQ